MRCSRGPSLVVSVHAAGSLQQAGGPGFGNGTAYAGLHMLAGAIPREAVRTRSFDTSPARRYAALMAGEFEATVLQEPWITVAEKAGCRLVCTTFFYGTWVADAAVDADTYAAFVRASTAAMRRINADKRRYLHYFTREYQRYPEVDALTLDDFPLVVSRSRRQHPSPRLMRAGTGSGCRVGPSSAVPSRPRHRSTPPCSGQRTSYNRHIQVQSDVLNHPLALLRCRNSLC